MCSFSDTNIDPNGLRNRWFQIRSRSLIVRLWIVLERTPLSVALSFTNMLARYLALWL